MPPRRSAPAAASEATLVARGEYLVRAGSCLGCHTEPGGEPYAGGRAIETPFGIVYGPNLTPDVATGLGAWTGDDFWRALHNGKARDGRLLYPAFPYPNYTRLERADADAMLAYLRSLPPVAKANRPHALDFPFDQAAALAVWRALFFRPGHFEPDPARTASWNRGAYLVETLGHCNACHSQRNALRRDPRTVRSGRRPDPDPELVCALAQGRRRGRRRRLAGRPDRRPAQERGRAARLRAGTDGRGRRPLDPAT